MRFQILPSAILALCLTQPALEERTMLHSLWHQGDSEAIHTGLLSRDQLEEHGLGLLDRGLRLVDIETAVVNGRRGFAGLFSEGSGGNFFVVGLSLGSLRARMGEMRSNGLHMIDVEAYRNDGQTRFAAVFGPGSGNQVIVSPLRSRN